MLTELAIRDIPVWQYESSALRKRQEEEFLPHVCPIFETRLPQRYKAFTLHLKVKMITSSNFAVLLKSSLSLYLLTKFI